jgi:hypothetical protein
MAVTIIGVVLQGTQAFAVTGSTSVANKGVRSQAFIGQSAASAEASTTSDANNSWAVTLSLNSPYDGEQLYRVTAITADDEGTEATVPPFFGPGPGPMI